MHLLTVMDAPTIVEVAMERLLRQPLQSHATGFMRV